MEIRHTYRDAKEIVKTCLKGGRTPALWGPPGIGKSSLGREIATELGAELYILDVPLLQPIDYAVAVPNHNSKKIELYPSGFLPEKGPAIVLVEDLPLAKQYQTIPVMQMVLDHRIGPMRFANDVWFIITGNLEDHLAGVNPIISPLLNRVIHILMEPDIDEWISWGKENGIVDTVLGFVRAYPNMFCQLPQESVKAWPTPRSWHMFSDVLQQVNGNEKMIRSLLDGCVGAEVAHMYITWVKYLKGVDPSKIIESKEIPTDITDRGKAFAVLQSVANHLKKKGISYVKKYSDGVTTFFKALTGEYKMAFLKELVITGKNGNADTKLIATVMEEVPETAKYVMDLISPQEGWSG